MVKIELPIKEIIDKYENGKTQKELAKEYRVSQPTIFKRIKEYYEENHKGDTKKLIRSKSLPMEEIIGKYENGFLQSQLAEEYGVGLSTIGKKIREYYNESGKNKPVYNRGGMKRKELPVDEIVKKYEQGISQEQLGREYNVTHTTIKNSIHEYYANKKERSSSKYIVNQEINLPIEEIVEKYKNGIDEFFLADEYGVSYSTILKKIKKFYENKNDLKPKRVRSATIILEYLKKGLTIEQILEIAENKNIIIPENIINIALNKIKGESSLDDNEER